MMTPELRKMMEFAGEQVVKLFQREGQLLPMYHMVRRNGDTMVMPAPPGDKDTSVALVRAYMELSDVVRYVFMNECWTLDTSERLVSSTELERIRREGVSQHPDRREAIMIIGEDETGLYCARRYILRPEHGKPKLSPFTFDEVHEGGTWEGRMIGLLPRPKTTRLS